MCEVLGISRSTFYKYRDNVDKDYQEYLIIKDVFEKYNCLYGYRRLKKALLIEYGWIVNHKKISRIMRKYGMEVRYKNVYKINYKKKYIKENVKENLLKVNFSSDECNKKWVTDITYLIHNGKVAYLSTILDLHTRDIVSYDISYKNDNKLVIDTLNKALEIRKDVQGLILHSDRGFQYTSNQYRAICEGHGILISMSRKGTPSDNAPIESFHSSLKRETLYSYNISSLEEYIVLVENWLKFYNESRIRLIA